MKKKRTKIRVPYPIKAGLPENVLALRLIANAGGDLIQSDKHGHCEIAVRRLIVVWRAHGYPETKVVRLARQAVKAFLSGDSVPMGDGINPVVEFMADVEEMYPFSSIDELIRQVVPHERCRTYAAAKRAFKDAVDAGLIVRRKSLLDPGYEYLLAHEPITTRVLAVADVVECAATDRRGVPLKDVQYTVGLRIGGGVYRALEAVCRAINAGVVRARCEHGERGRELFLMPGKASRKGGAR